MRSQIKYSQIIINYEADWDLRFWWNICLWGKRLIRKLFWTEIFYFSLSSNHFRTFKAICWLASKHHLFRAFFFFCWKVKPFQNLNMPFFKFSSDVKNFSVFFRQKNKLQLLAMKFSYYHELRKQIMQITKAKYLATSLCIGMVQQFNLTVEHRSLRWNSFLQSCL
jgi:hypothetical protein